ncbi:MAG: hypothetical protein K9I85_15920 [Saprospiraceae bacterium]|nr:hypothetical protein [Saprospiraceae bacterium]
MEKRFSCQTLVLLLGILLMSMSGCNIYHWTVGSPLNVEDLIYSGDQPADIYVTARDRKTYWRIHPVGVEGESLFGEVVSETGWPLEFTGRKSPPKDCRSIRLLLQEKQNDLTIEDGKFTLPLDRIDRIQEYKKDREAVWVLAISGAILIPLPVLALIFSSDDNSGLFGGWSGPW